MNFDDILNAFLESREKAKIMVFNHTVDFGNKNLLHFALETGKKEFFHFCYFKQQPLDFLKTLYEPIIVEFKSNAITIDPFGIFLMETNYDMLDIIKDSEMAFVFDDKDVVEYFDYLFNEIFIRIRNNALELQKSGDEEHKFFTQVKNLITLFENNFFTILTHREFYEKNLFKLFELLLLHNLTEPLDGMKIKDFYDFNFENVEFTLRILRKLKQEPNNLDKTLVFMKDKNKVFDLKKEFLVDAVTKTPLITEDVGQLALALQKMACTFNKKPGKEGKNLL